METRRILKEGFIAGLVLYMTVALFFAGVNVLAGRSPFYTALVLGQPLLGAVPDPLDPSPTAPAVMAFNSVHLLASLALGAAAAVLVGAIEKMRGAWYVFFFIFVAGSIVTIVGLGVLTAETSHLLPWHSVATAHLAGAATTTAYLWWSHATPEPDLGEPTG
ncbi:MAG: hypothetical protein WD960_09710 [Gemmatimonadota bacterium]